MVCWSTCAVRGSSELVAVRALPQLEQIDGAALSCREQRAMQVERHRIDRAPGPAAGGQCGARSGRETRECRPRAQPRASRRGPPRRTSQLRKRRKRTSPVVCCKAVSKALVPRRSPRDRGLRARAASPSSSRPSSSRIASAAAARDWERSRSLSAARFWCHAKPVPARRAQRVPRGRSARKRRARLRSCFSRRFASRVSRSACSSLSCSLTRSGRASREPPPRGRRGRSHSEARSPPAAVRPVANSFRGEGLEDTGERFRWYVLEAARSLAR